MRINQKLLLVIVGFMFIPYFLISLYSYFSEKNVVTDRIISQLESIAAIEKSNIENVANAHLDEIKAFATKLQLRIILTRYNLDKSADDRDYLVSNISEAAKASASIRDIYILDKDGIVVASVNRGLIGTDFSDRDFFKKGKAGFDGNMFVKNPDGVIDQYLAGPLIYNNQLQGVAVIVDNTNEFANLSQNYAGLGETGEVYVVRAMGSDIVLMTPLRFEPQSALVKVIPPELSYASSQAVKKVEQTFIGITDYRGQKVIASTGYIGAYDWGVVVKIDMDEVFKPLRDMTSTLLMVILLLIILVSWVYFMLQRIINRPIINMAKDLESYCDEESCPVRAVEVSDETEYLANVVKQMIQNLRLRRRLIGKENDELQKINKIAVNRELKMRELKKEIDELKKKIKT